MAKKALHKNQNQRAQEAVGSLDWEQLHAKIKANVSLDSIEACGFLGMPPRTLTEKVGRGEIPVIKLGRRLSFLPSDLEEYRQSKRERRAVA